MKSVVRNEKKGSDRPFPKLMIDPVDGLVTLLKSAEEGVVVAEGNNAVYYIGYYSKTWNTSHLEDFEGEVTLSND